MDDLIFKQTIELYNLFYGFYLGGVVSFEGNIKNFDYQERISGEKKISSSYMLLTLDLAVFI